MQQIIVNLAISADLCALHYSGAVQQVIARTLDGRRVQFPANILRSILRRDGIYGTFRITYNEQGRFHSIEALAP